jgi:hypothetical protein
MLSVERWRKIWDYVDRLVRALERIADAMEWEEEE